MGYIDKLKGSYIRGRADVLRARAIAQKRREEAAALRQKAAARDQRAGRERPNRAIRVLGQVVETTRPVIGAATHIAASASKTSTRIGKNITPLAPSTRPYRGGDGGSDAFDSLLLTAPTAPSQTRKKRKRRSPSTQQNDPYSYLW